MAFTTRHTLLSKIKNGDNFSWDEFYNLYKKLIWLRCGDFGLFDEDKEEIIQDVMSEFFRKKTVNRYDRSNGKFKNFFKKVVTDKIKDFLRKKSKQGIHVELAENMDAIFSNPELDQLYDEEWKNHIYSQAIEEVKEIVSAKEFQVFNLSEKNTDTKLISQLVGVKESSIYVYKKRVVDKLTEIVKDLSSEE